MTTLVEFVPEEDTLAVITIKESQSASLRTTNAILLALLLIASYFLNILFVVAVLITKSFRTLINLMYCHLILVNLIDLSFNVLFALLYVANGNWNMSDGWCKFNVGVQMFVHTHTLFVLMLIGVERAIGMSFGWPYIPNADRAVSTVKMFIINLVIAFFSFVSASILFMKNIPVKPFRNRYVCGIDSGGSLSYAVFKIATYVFALSILFMCIGTILKKRTAASLPQSTQEYVDFIRRNRGMQEHKSKGKLLVLLLCVFILIEGPYIALCSVYEIYNSQEMKTEGMDIPQDADTLITWLKFVFPLICPIIMLSWCNDIWLKVKEVMCCTSYDPPTIGHYVPFRMTDEVSPVPSVMTIVATDDGISINEDSNPRSYTRSNLATGVTHSAAPREVENPISSTNGAPRPATPKPPSQPAPVQQSPPENQATPKPTKKSLIPKPKAKKPSKMVIRKKVIATK
ncbi:unnamed protein product [Caenorhabditis bovis]|uniref:G-protein coupled receptors family 1 profile domain-containing protein n=1 Tax=Caenorhabditis bovis TaxID=2654633 RepID=A0A8S1EGW4_9PELO|nr:unnamed protein product [Caenorhabditis bovis]